MTSKAIFLDNNATTQPTPEVQKAMLFAMNEGFGNPSSSHRGGESARRIITRARDQIADLIGSLPSQVYFTSGATESNNWIINSFLETNPESAVVTTEVEHSSIKELVESCPRVNANRVRLPISNEGLIQIDLLVEICEAKKGILTVHWVNNETGVVQPIEEIAEVCKAYDFVLHVDGSQAVGKLPIDLTRLDIDFLTFTAHKFHGPQGVGALFSRMPNQLGQLFFGGGQESGLRPGTENLPGIAGFGKAAELRYMALDAVTKKLSQMRDRFEQQILNSIPKTFVNGSTIYRVCNTTNLRFEGVDGQALVAQLDAAGIQCSQSSACTAQIPEPSYVLRAMGLSEKEAYSCVRFSFSELNTFEEIDKAVQVLTERVKTLRDFKRSVTAS